MKKNYKKGVTALELLFVMSIFVIIIGVVTAQLSKLKENQTLNASATDIVSTISKARSETLASVNSSEYGVHFQSDKVIIFKGTSYSSSASTNEAVLISSPITISNVTLGGVSGSSGDMYFNRIYGAPSTTGTITVSAQSTSKTITISATGLASMN